MEEVIYGSSLPQCKDKELDGEAEHSARLPMVWQFSVPRSNWELLGRDEEISGYTETKTC